MNSFCIRSACHFLQLDTIMQLIIQWHRFWHESQIGKENKTSEPRELKSLKAD